MLGGIPIVFCCVCYTALALTVTRRCRKNMIREYGRDGGNGEHRFQPVQQSEQAGGAPPPYNPNYTDYPKAV